jgi:hypothetical protein
MNNGGRPEMDRFDVPSCSGNPTPRIHFFFGVDDSSESYDLAGNVAVYQLLPPGMIAIASTEGADLICLAPSGAIVFWDGYDESRRLHDVAPSFEAFLAKLRRDDDSPELPAEQAEPDS